MERLEFLCQDLSFGNKIVDLGRKFPDAVSSLEDIVQDIVANISKGKSNTVPKPDKINVGSGWCVIPQQSFSTPRNKFDVELLRDGSYILHTKTTSYKVSVASAIYLPPVVQSVCYLLLILKEPLIVGKQSLPCLLLSPTSADPKISTLQVRIKAESPGSTMRPGQQILDSPYKVWYKLLQVQSQVTPTEPTSTGFKSSTGQLGVKCYHNVEDGILYLTSRGLVFVKKPLLFLALEDIQVIALGRSGSSATRNFDLSIVMKDSTRHEIRMIETLEYDRIVAYVQATGVNDKQQSTEATDADEAADKESEDSDASDSAFEESESSDEGSGEESGNDTEDSEPVKTAKTTRKTRSAQESKLETLSDVDDESVIEGNIPDSSSSEESSGDSSEEDEDEDEDDEDGDEKTAKNNSKRNRSVQPVSQKNHTSIDDDGNDSDDTVSDPGSQPTKRPKL